MRQIFFIKCSYTGLSIFAIGAIKVGLNFASKLAIDDSELMRFPSSFIDSEFISSIRHTIDNSCLVSDIGLVVNIFVVEISLSLRSVLTPYWLSSI